jgi:uncharacterized protein
MQHIIKVSTMTTQSFYERRPLMVVALLETIVIAVHIPFLILVKTATLSDVAADGVIYIILTAIAVWLLTRQQWWQETGFRWPNRTRYLLLFWLPALPLILNLLAGLKPTTTNPARILVLLVISLLVGFVEEAFYRGLILRALLPKGIWPAVIISALLFGFSHAINLFSGENWQYVLLQITYATMIYGFASAALVIYTKTIIPLVVIHFLIDFGSFWQANGTTHTTGITAGDIFVTVVGSAMALIYGVILLVLASRRR